MMQTPVRDWVTVREFLARYKGVVGRNTVYDRIRDKTIPSIRLGRRILIPSDALDRLLAEVTKANGTGKPAH